MRKLLTALIIGLGLASLAEAQSKPAHSYYDSPFPSTTTGSCEMGLVKGPFYVHKSTSGTGNPYVVLSSTHGVYSAYGITGTTLTLTGVTADPAASTGTFCYRSDLDQVRLKTLAGWVSITTGTASNYVSTTTIANYLNKTTTDTITAGLIVNGYVGIGTSSPTTQLDVNGGIKANGSLSVKTTNFIVNDGVQIGTTTRMAVETINQPAGTSTLMLNISTGTQKQLEVTGTSITIGSGMPVFFDQFGTSISASGGNLSLNASTVVAPSGIIQLNDYHGWATYIATSSQMTDQVNISSVSRTAAGLFKVTPSHSLANANYAPFCQSMVNLTITHTECEVDSPAGANPKTTTSFGCRCISVPGATETDPFQLFISFDARIILP